MSFTAQRTGPDTWQIGPVEVAYSHEGLHISTRTEHVFVYGPFGHAFTQAVTEALRDRQAALDAEQAAS